MRSFGTLLALFLMIASGSLTPASANGLDGVSKVDVSEIQGVISAQLEAFQVDDGDLAFSFASPSIQGIFQTPDRFMKMVKTGYRPVYRPRQIEFGELIELRGQPTQLVTLVGPDGSVVAAYYIMERQPDGLWRINGCMLREAPAV